MQKLMEYQALEADTQDAASPNRIVHLTLPGGRGTEAPSPQQANRWREGSARHRAMRAESKQRDSARLHFLYPAALEKTTDFLPPASSPDLKFANSESRKLAIHAFFLLRGMVQ
jgi:hypothetical protein